MHSGPMRRSRRARRAVITLTPLIDVVFILLVFFMLASSLAEQRSLPLGPSLAASSARTEGQPVAVVLVPDQTRVQVGNVEVSLSDLPAAVRRELNRPGRNGIVVQAAEQSSVQDLVAVLDVLGRTEVAGVALSPSDSGRRTAEGVLSAH